MDTPTLHPSHPSFAERRAAARRLVLDVTGLASVMTMFDDAVVELWDDEPPDSPDRVAA